MAADTRRCDGGERLMVSPLVAIHETEKDVLLEAEMSGLDKESIGLEVKGDELTIRGIRKEAETPKGYTALYRERCPFEYSRTFVLGSEVDRDRISAKYEDGVLTLTIPKSDESQPRKIAIA